MRRLAITGMALLALMPVSLLLASIDTSDVDTYLMQDMENALKSLEPVLTAGNFDSALADAHTLRDGLQYVHEYFVGKGAQDGVQIAVEGREAVTRALAAIDKRDQPASIAAARAIASNCKSCHDIYKP